MSERFIAWLNWLLPSSLDEAETERDGVLSTRREWHAAIGGLAVGVVVAMTGSWELAGLFVFAVLGSKLTPEHFRDLRREPWYALSLFLIGVVVTKIVVKLS